MIKAKTLGMALNWFDGNVVCVYCFHWRLSNTRPARPISREPAHATLLRRLKGTPPRLMRHWWIACRSIDFRNHASRYLQQHHAEYVWTCFPNNTENQLVQLTKILSLSLCILFRHANEKLYFWELWVHANQTKKLKTFLNCPKAAHWKKLF